MSRHLLVLDLDEVLVYSTEDTSVQTYDFQLGSYRVRKRPFLDEFLKTISGWFALAVWTSATHDYAELLINRLFPNPTNLKFIWSRKRCTMRRDLERGDSYWVKDMKKLKRHGFDLSKVLAIEDEPRTLERNYGNLVTVRAFEGDHSDTELRDLLPFLNWIRTADNVRVIEKRYWRTFNSDERVKQSS